VLRFWLGLPQTGFANFVYLCELCGAGSLTFLGALAASRAITVSQFLTLWRDLESSWNAVRVRLRP